VQQQVWHTCSCRCSKWNCWQQDLVLQLQVLLCWQQAALALQRPQQSLHALLPRQRWHTPLLLLVYVRLQQ
jgi:hypothetical protein